MRVLGRFSRSLLYRNQSYARILLLSSLAFHPLTLISFTHFTARIQVEHTITEEITGIDIVAAQIQIAGGATLPELGLTQETITKRGYAIQCRITTEDAAQGFQPDTGKIEVYRSAGGNGVRLDASSGFAGAQVTVSGFHPSVVILP